MYIGNFVFAITVNCLYSCFFYFRALSTQQGGYVRATNLYYDYFALAQHEKKDLVFPLPVTPQVKLRPVALDLECLSQNPCCP